MSLFEPHYPITTSPEEAVAIVHAFLGRCLQWAEEKELPKTQSALEKEHNPQVAARLLQWETYRDFTRHTLKELEDGTLDHWFQGDPSPDE